MKLRGYQKKAVNESLRLLNRGDRVCLVSPVGSGKTTMAAEVVRRARDAGAACFAISHRHEINQQLRERLNVPVNTFQTLCRETDQSLFEHVDLLILDEAHHQAADKWSSVTGLFPNARLLGLTATPVRSDGAPLGDWFDSLVVAEHYPELVRAGYLCPVRIVRPDACTAPDIALDPVDAYKKYTPGTKAFLFAGNVEQAQYLSEQFNKAGIASAAIHGGTPGAERELSIKLFRELGVQVLCSVHILTEGVDIPEAATCIIARGCGHPSTYLQMVGRVLRPHPSKTFATLLDLTGISWIHGSPIARREYSLDKGISLEPSLDVVDCPQCAACYKSGQVKCEVCGWNFKENGGKRRKPLIMSQQLQEVYAGIDTPPKAKAQELDHLFSVAQKKGYSISWALRKYRDLFDEMPQLDRDQKATILEEELVRAIDKGHKPGSAIYRYKDLFESNPDWNTWNRLKRKYGV